VTDVINIELQQQEERREEEEEKKNVFFGTCCMLYIVLFKFSKASGGPAGQLSAFGGGYKHTHHTRQRFLVPLNLRFL
jgi:hypothetical protein